MSKTREKWTKKRVLEDAKQYSSLEEWKKNSPSAVIASRRHKIYYEATAHMPRRLKRWTNLELIEEGKKFNTRFEFQKKSNSAYQIALDRNLVEAFAHMKPVGHRFKRQIYAIENANHSVYIGLSRNPLRRYDEHLSKGSKQTCDKILQEHVCGQNLRIFEEFYSVEEASQKEGYYIEKYRSEGWEILNTAKPGALGTPVIKHTLERCIELAKNCSGRRDFYIKNRSAYGTICNNKWHNVVFAHLPSKVRDKYTFEEVKKSAQDCKTRIEFRQKYHDHYAAAQRMKILQQITEHMGRGKTHPIEHDRIVKSAQECKTIKEFETKYPSEYHAARARGTSYWFQVAGHLKKLRTQRWIEESIKTDASHFSSFEIWKKERMRTSYQAARKRRLIPTMREFFKQMNSQIKKDK